MEIIEEPFKGLYHIKPKVFADERGYFFESFNRKVFESCTGLDVDFLQDNQSKSQKNVLRGLHFQVPPYGQGKLVRVITGKVLDVVVDLRKESATYGEHFKTVLNTEEHNMLWIPSGFAHGFLTLEDDTIFSYKCTAYYNPESERCIDWADSDLGIDWDVSSPVLSKKDQEGMSFKSFSSPF